MDGDDIHDEVTALRVSAAHSFEQTEAKLAEHNIGLCSTSFAAGYSWGWTNSMEREQTIRHAKNYDAVDELASEWRKLGCAIMVICVMAVFNVGVMVWQLFF